MDATAILGREKDQCSDAAPRQPRQSGGCADARGGGARADDEGGATEHAGDPKRTRYTVVPWPR